MNFNLRNSFRNLNLNLRLSLSLGLRLKSSISLFIVLLFLSSFGYSLEPINLNELKRQIGYSSYQTHPQLSPEEKSAIKLYQSTSICLCIQNLLFDSNSIPGPQCALPKSVKLPKTLKSTSSGDLIKNNLLQIITLIDNSIQKSKMLPGGLILYRGDGPYDVNINDHIERAGYTSTSLDINVAEVFYKESLLIIKIPEQGFPGLYLDAWEQEVILPRNTKFKVIDIIITDDTKKIVVEPYLD